MSDDPMMDARDWALADTCSQIAKRRIIPVKLFGFLPFYRPPTTIERILAQHVVDMTCEKHGRPKPKWPRSNP